MAFAVTGLISNTRFVQSNKSCLSLSAAWKYGAGFDGFGGLVWHRQPFVVRGNFWPLRLSDLEKSRAFSVLLEHLKFARPDTIAVPIYNGGKGAAFATKRLQFL